MWRIIFKEEKAMRDEEIIDLYFERNETAIVKTAEKYGAYCTRIALNILSDIFDSEECVNDTYHKVWNTVPPTRPNIFSAFIGRITRNLAIDRYNNRTADKRGGYTVAESLDELCECVGANDDAAVDLSDLGQIISSFLKGEKPLIRKIFVRRYFYEDSIEDIASSTGLGRSFIKTSLFRTRKRLAEHLKREGIFI